VDTAHTGNAICYQCHGPGSTLAYGDMTVFEDSGHATVDPPPSGSDIKCIACHQPHASRNVGLNRYAGYMVCMRCHTASTSNPNTPDIWSRLGLNNDANAKHPLLPQDQTTGAAMSCQNCHSTHATSRTYPLVEPHNPAPSGKWTGDRADQKSFCFECHDGGPLPIDAETQPWASAVRGQNATTTAIDIKSAYNTNAHGFGVRSDTATTTAFLRPDMGYSANAVLECRACHEPHGTVNGYALRQDVVSANGGTAIQGLLVYKIPAGSISATSPVGYDLRFFCSTCHLFDPATHDPMAGTDTTRLGQTDCTACHRHVRADGTPSDRL
jgi:predicted CXXCH cytochrome family protein